MAEIGIVIATDEKTATVAKCKASICDTCTKKSKIGACETCSDREEQAAERCVALNTIGAEIGDKVEYAKNHVANVIFTFVVFLVPVICALIAYLISTLIIDDPGASGRIAVAFFALAMIAAGLYSYKSSKRRCEYTISAILDE